MSTALVQPDQPQPPSIAEASFSDQEMSALERDALASMGQGPAPKPTDQPTDDQRQADDSASKEGQQQQQKEPKKPDPKPEPKGQDGKEPKEKQQPDQKGEPRNPEDIKDDPKDSAYRRTMKDLQRMGLTWERINAQREEAAQAAEAAKRDRATLDQERKEWETKLAELTTTPIPDAEIRGKKYSADVIRDHIAACFADGNAEQGQEALDLLVRQAQMGAAASALKPNRDQILAYNRDAEIACAKRPELLDPKAPVSSALRIMFAQPDVLALFTRRPGGFNNAVELAELLSLGMEAKANAEKLGTTTQEVVKLKERIAELEAQQMPGDGNQPRKGAALSEEEQFEQMSPEQQEAFLRRQFQPG